MKHEDGFWNPYVAGLALGLVLLASFVLMGFGLGSSGAAARLGFGALHVVAPSFAEQHPYLAHYVGHGRNPLDDWLVYLVLGVFLGGLVAATTAGRRRTAVILGSPSPWSRGKRLAVALAGGFLMGFAARLARGCTSGQALSGGAVLSLGSWIFMLAVFAGGYAAAPFVRRQWK